MRPDQYTLWERRVDWSTNHSGSYEWISSALVYAWKIGLKTGVYYTRAKSKLKSNAKLSSSTIKEDVPSKPADSLFACAGGGCST